MWQLWAKKHRLSWVGGRGHNRAVDHRKEKQRPFQAGGAQCSSWSIGKWGSHLKMSLSKVRSCRTRSSNITRNHVSNEQAMESELRCSVLSYHCLYWHPIWMPVLFWFLYLQFSLPLMHLGKQDKMTQEFGPRHPRWCFRLLSSAQPCPDDWVNLGMCQLREDLYFFLTLSLSPHPVILSLKLKKRSFKEQPQLPQRPYKFESGLKQQNSPEIWG